MSTIQIPCLEAKHTLTKILCEYLPEDKATKLATIFIDAELDGVRSHGLARFSRLIGEIRQGFIVPTGEPSLVKSFAGWEMWDGNAGPGPLSALHCTLRATEVAQQFGLACVGLRNTNHWLRPGYYAKQAARAGCAFIAWSNTMPNMRAHGATKTSLSNTPVTIALPPTSNDENLCFIDLALSQFSYGKMQASADTQSPLSIEGGYDSNGNLTRDAEAIIQNQSASAIGFWKGSALAIVLDLLAVFFAGGKSVYEIGALPGEQQMSQAFIAVALNKLWDTNEYSMRLKELKSQLKSIDPSTHIPGETLQTKRKQHMDQGIRLSSSLWQDIQKLEK